MRIDVFALDRFLRRAESHIALLDRARPVNGPAERARLLSAWRAGQAAAPEFEYAEVRDLSRLRSELRELAERLGEEPAWNRLYAERALELESEAAIAEAVGSPRTAALARARYRASSEESRAALAQAKRFCRARSSPRAVSERVYPSDDEREPRSLVAALRRRAGELKLPLRIEVRDDLASAAATTMDGRILVASGRSYTAEAIRRIVTHEIEAHALPRQRAASEACGLFAVGTAQGADDEEGRALLLEKRAGCLGPERRLELGLRHHAALAVRDEATFVETVRALLGLDAELETAIDLSCRAHRGGGLGREFVYLTAFCRVRRALEQSPELESWLERGRISIEAARTLSTLGAAPRVLEVRDAPQPSAKNSAIKRWASEKGGGTKNPCGERSSSRSTHRASSSSS